jgi:hypothetical protein
VEQRKVSAMKSLRCLVIFQLKLGADAIRDLVMSPVSIVMFFLDLIFRPNEKDSNYQQMMRFGRKTDRWINLFEENYEPEEKQQPSEQPSK